MANELNEKMWQTFGHGSPAFQKANPRQVEGILYVRQHIRRSAKAVDNIPSEAGNKKEELANRLPAADTCETSNSPMNSPAPCPGREESVAGDVATVTSVDSGAITPISPGDEPRNKVDLDKLYGITDKGWRNRVLEYWQDNLSTEELEEIRDSLDVTLVEREDADKWEEVILADDEREEETAKAAPMSELKGNEKEGEKPALPAADIPKRIVRNGVEAYPETHEIWAEIEEAFHPKDTIWVYGCPISLTLFEFIDLRIARLKEATKTK